MLTSHGVTVATN